MLVVLFDNAGYLSQKTDVVHYYPQGSAVQTGRFAGTPITPRPGIREARRGLRRLRREGELARDVAAALERGLEQAQKRLALVHMVLA